MTAPDPAGRSRTVEDSLPAVGAIVTGVAGGVALIVSQRYLGLEAIAPLAQLWTVWAVMAAGLTFSFQQWAAIHPVQLSTFVAADHRRVTASIVGLSLVTLIVARLAQDAIFHADGWIWPLAAATMPIGTALNGVCRGVLARRQERLLLAIAIAGENVVRLVVSVVLVLLAASVSWFAGALLAGFVVVALARDGEGESAPTDAGNRAALGASAIAGFLGYALMFGSPLLLGAAGGEAADIAALFLVLTGVRVPFVVLQALIPQLAVGLSSAPDRSVLIATTRRRVAIAAVAGGLAAGAVAFVLGDLVIGSIFAIRGEIADRSYAVLAAASVLAACALVATVILVVETRSQQIVFAWGLAVVSGVVVTALGVVDEVAGLSLWLLGAHATVVAIALIPAADGAASASEGEHRQ